MDDIKAFADAGAADYAQIKTPDLGGINNTIEAVLYARAKGMGCCVGGSGNETDQSARITAQIPIPGRVGNAVTPIAKSRSFCFERTFAPATSWAAIGFRLRSKTAHPII